MHHKCACRPLIGPGDLKRPHRTAVRRERGAGRRLFRRHQITHPPPGQIIESGIIGKVRRHQSPLPGNIRQDQSEQFVPGPVQVEL